MKKIKTVFRIDRDLKRATKDVLPGSEWVLNGEGFATLKYDGTAASVQNGQLFKRYDRRLERSFAKRLKREQGFQPKAHMFKPAPEGWMACEAEPDLKTGHWPGWLAISQDAPEDQWFREAFNSGEFEDGTYELVGPKVQSNKYKLSHHELWRHGKEQIDIDRSFEAISDWLHANSQEGLVFHHPDGRMAKIRRKDFGLNW